MDRMKRLADAIKSLSDEEFSGYLKINFTQGSLGRVEKSEEVEVAQTALMHGGNGIKKNGGNGVHHGAL
ncbi:MAG: hypothetical protein C4581_00545 [Nitrospiraceae bacterium]|nr:MAG: hypothetical protein C4581_00545 [Nitrospiraceae bacterium]